MTPGEFAMPKAHHHKKHGHKRPRRTHASVHDHPATHAKRSHAQRRTHHRTEARHEQFGSFPGALRKKLERPVTVKTLQDIVALRRVQRGG
jgi:hypothetical protein